MTYINKKTYTYKKYAHYLGNTKIVSTDMIQRIEDKSVIPFDPNNLDYQAYLAWVAEGNTPAEAD